MADHPLLTIHTDGASRGNPGAAASAYVIARSGQPAIEAAERLGLMTNNQAEYTALVRALEHALELGPEHSLLIHSDSELMVKQMRGEYRVKNEELRELYAEARRLVQRFQGRVSFQHVRREQNSRADALCNEVLDGKRPSASGKKKPAASPAVPPPSPVPGGTARLSLRAQALARLRDAILAWSEDGAGETPEQVWDDLVRLLEQHGVKVP
jgi:ribonuclease HI